jgi:hypothetical protein
MNFKGWNFGLIKNPVLLLTGFFLLFGKPVCADQEGGQRPAAYLELGGGGAQNAMAGAAVADRNDPACGFWNPAGLSGLRGFQIEDQYTLLPLGQQLDYFALANGFRDFFFYGLTAFIYSAGGNIEARVGPSLTPDSEFGDLEMTYMASLAFRLSPRWSIGGNLKVETQNFENYSGFGFGEDIGLQYRITQFTTLGLMIQDPLTVFNYDNSTENIVPLTVKAGLAHHDQQLNAKFNFELDWGVDFGLEPRLGVEWRPMEVLALRGGCWAGNIINGVSGGPLGFYPTAGVGILLPVGYSGDGLLEVDYTLLTDQIVTGNFLHQISITGKFL